MTNVKVTFKPANISVLVNAGTTIMEAARLAGLAITAPCGGTGRCGKCRVDIISPVGEEKQVLACQRVVENDLTVELDQSQQPVILAEGESRQFTLEPALVVSNRGPLIHRAGISIPRPEGTGPPLGLAIDLGTTTIVGYLHDLTTGQRLAVSSLANGQQTFGADVMSRLSHALLGPPHYQEVRQAGLASLDSLIAGCCERASVAPESIKEMVIVGNTPMIHILLNLPVQGLAMAPFQPYAKGPWYLTARELGLCAAPLAVCYLPPLIGGFVGSDALAATLAQGFGTTNETNLLVDIGTNGEILLQAAGKLLAASAPAGPALEGGNIACGMVAQPGAVSRILMDYDVHLEVIDGKDPRGICGSALVDALAEMLRLNIIDRTGRMLSPAELPPIISFKIKQRLKQSGDHMCFMLTDDLYIGQQDIREVQLAKAAVAAGIRVLIDDAGIKEGDVDWCLLAGGFGNYLNPANALRIGLLGAQSSARVKQVGNAAGAGAIMMLLSYSERRHGENLSQQFNHLELATDQRYQGAFMDQLYFPHKEYVDKF